MTSSSTPSWQVDIPGLSQLILNVGSHGLKQLAMAGVDIHSIGCMLMIAEFTPASQEFRKKITNARQVQRSERQWLYKVVEIGAATNFLADQLLKTRAGENVLALMAATVPLMNEDMCITALTALFEGAKVSLDNIPGLNQLRAIRTNLAPLARKVGIGEKTLHYHQFLCSLHHQQKPMSHEDPYLAVPVATDIASIVRMLHKIASCEDPYVLICRGLRGSAWITAYASDVLGLRVCALHANGNIIPITAAYETAQVIIELDSDKSECGMYLNRNLQEQLQLQPKDPEQRQGWSVDLDQLHFLEYRHPKITRSTSLARLSAFVALDTLNRVSAKCTQFSTSNNAWRRSDYDSYFVGYAESELRHIQARSLRILRQLGFIPGNLEDYKFNAAKGCPTYTAAGLVFDLAFSYLGLDEEHYGVGLGEIMGGKERTVDRIHHFLAAQNAQSDSLDLASGVVPAATSNSEWAGNFLDWQKHIQYDFAHTVHIASVFASHLAFSDWDVSLRRMSAQYLWHGEIPKSHGLFEADMAIAMTLCADTVHLSILETRSYHPSWCCF